MFQLIRRRRIDVADPTGLVVQTNNCTGAMFDQIPLSSLATDQRLFALLQ